MKLKEGIIYFGTLLILIAIIVFLAMALEIILGDVPVMAR